MNFKTKYSRLTYSYLDLRKTVGWIGILLPFTLMFGLLILFNGEDMPTSISHYYHTSMRNVFVGALCAVALFMFFYCGYNKLDDWAGNIAGFFAIGVAWVPTTEGVGETDLIGLIHYTCAAIFFLTLASFSLILFTKTKKEFKITSRKKKRNLVYRICGIIIIVCLIAIVAHKKFEFHPYFVFWAETVALIAFGVSWLTKGGALYPDKKL